MVKKGLQIQTKRHFSLARHWDVGTSNKMSNQLMVEAGFSAHQGAHHPADDSGPRRCYLDSLQGDVSAVVLVAVAGERGGGPERESELMTTLGTL